MNIKQLADFLGLSPNTVRNWLSEYQEFFSPGANPPPGDRRVLSDIDLRVVAYIAGLRKITGNKTEVVSRLKDSQHDDWSTLPELPAEWNVSEESVPVGVATYRANELAQLAVLQRELQYTRSALETAEAKAREFQDKLQSTESQAASLNVEKHELELEVVTLRGRVAQLESELKGYSLAYGLGGSKPVNLLLIIGITAAGAVILMLIAVVVGALLR
jgi:hypothetical protein